MKVKIKLEIDYEIKSCRNALFDAISIVELKDVIEQELPYLAKDRPLEDVYHSVCDTLDVKYGSDEIGKAAKMDRHDEELYDIVRQLVAVVEDSKISVEITES